MDIYALEMTLLNNFVCKDTNFIGKKISEITRNLVQK